VQAGGEGHCALVGVHLQDGRQRWQGEGRENNCWQVVWCVECAADQQRLTRCPCRGTPAGKEGGGYRRESKSVLWVERWSG
jgi:hypothetical protein